MKIMRPLMVLAAGTLLGTLMWHLSPFITGKPEAWDAMELYYPLSLFLGGAGATVLSPRHFWAAPVGMFAGQALYVQTQIPPGTFGPLGLIISAPFFLASLAGGACVWRLLRRPAPKGR